jgi:hypothetical protein
MSTPTPDWWQAVSPYLDEALELSEREREVWLASLRERDEPLARHLERLLRDHGALARDGFLEQGPAMHPHSAELTGNVVGGTRCAHRSVLAEWAPSGWPNGATGSFTRRLPSNFLPLDCVDQGGASGFCASASCSRR